MIELFYGKDTYRSLKEFKKNSKENKEFELLFFDFSLNKEENILFFKKELSQNSIFNKKKKFLLKNLILAIKNDLEIISFFKKEENLNNFYFFIWENDIDKKNEIFKVIQKKGKIKNFEKLKNGDLKKWVLDEIKKRGGKIKEDALDKMIFSLDNDLWLISNEIDKLIAYKKNDEIEKEDIDLLTNSKVEGDIFKAIGFLAERKRKEALNIFYNHIKKGDHVLYLITMITFQFRNLILIKKRKQEGPKELGMHPFVFQKSLRQANLFSEIELKIIYKKIMKAEIDIKTGKATPEAALELLVSEIK